MTLEQRFWAKVEKTGDGCWNWTGSHVGNGYGEVYVRAERKMVRAHRVSWELHFGPIPDGQWVLHRCDNRECVRPDHLFLGNNSDNL